MEFRRQRMRISSSCFDKLNMSRAASLLAGPEQVDKASPGDPGYQAVLAGGHGIVHHLAGETLHRLRSLGHMPRRKRRMRIIFNHQLDRFGAFAASDLAASHSARSMPAETPAAVTILPARTMRSLG